MHPIFILKCSELISPYDLFLRKLYGTWDSNMNEVNQILFCMLRDSSTPLTCFCENYKMPESNVNEVNPILFASAVSPPAPMTFFFVKIVLCMRVNIKRWIQLLFVYTASPPSPITSFMWKLHGLWVKCKSYQYFARNEGKEINKKAKPALTYNWTWIFLVGLYQNLQKIGHLITQ